MVYKKAWKLDTIIDFFEIEKSKHFDPVLTEIFLENMDRMVCIRDSYKD